MPLTNAMRQIADSSVIIVNGSRMSMLLINLLTVRATIDRMKMQIIPLHHRALVVFANDDVRVIQLPAWFEILFHYQKTRKGTA